jgi:DNA-binding transcriptional LysR family regulator
MLLHPNVRVFLLAARHLSFTLAAKEVALSQPAVTARIKKLEESLAVELFTRLPSGLQLTPAGSVFYDYVQRLEVLSSEAQRAALDIAEGDEAHLYLGANRSATSYMLPSLLLHFSKRHPKVRIRTAVLPSERLLDRLSSGYLDAVLVEQHVDSERYYVKRLMKDEVVFVLGKDHELAHKDTLSLSDLLKTPLITHEPNSGTRQILAHQLELHGASDTDLNIVMELQSSELVKEMAACDMGIGLISRLALSNNKNKDKLVIKRMEGEPMFRHFHLVCTQQSVGRSKVQELIDIALSIYDDQMLFGGMD